MKMLRIKNVLKLSTGVALLTVFAAQANAGDIALTGSYGNYMRDGCSWVFGSSNNYGPTYGVPNGATTNAVNVAIDYLICSGSTAPKAVKVVQTNYIYTVPYWSSRIQTSQTCSIGRATGWVEGNCSSYRVYD